MEERLKSCPFCGCQPKIKPDKKTHCQLHGEPSQQMIVYCDWKDCAAKPMVKAGDIYNGIGDAIYKDKATQEAIKVWNTRPVTLPSEKLVPITMPEIKDIGVDLIDEFFPKGQCQERGQAIVLYTKLLIAICDKFAHPPARLERDWLGKLCNDYMTKHRDENDGYGLADAILSSLNKE